MDLSQFVTCSFGNSNILPFPFAHWYNRKMGSFMGMEPWQPGIAAVLTIIALIYGRGWRHYHPSRPLRAHLLFGAGLTTLFVAVASPLHQLASQFFFVRTAQHLLIIAWVPALLLASDPWPVLKAGLPQWVKGYWGGKRPSPAWQALLRFLTAPGTVWLMLICTFWLWYDPVLHQATLIYPWLRGLEITMLFLPAMLYWWHVTGAAPHWHNHLSLIGRIVFTIAATMPIKIVGLILLFVPETVYDYPHSQIAGIVFDAESLGGVLVWILGGIVYSWTAVYLAGQWLARESNKPALPGTIWDTEEAMLAPGLRSK
jgi:cytochrome c oxidase assembly factor CtaG